MSGSWKYVLTLFLAVVAIYFGVHLLIRLVTGLFAAVLALAVPILVVAGVAYVLYALINRKALGSGNRRSLP